MHSAKSDLDQIVRDTTAPEALVEQFYQSLTARQRDSVCFDWDYRHEPYGLLRDFISNDWRVSQPAVNSPFYTDYQRRLVRAIFAGLTNPAWHARFERQARDDLRVFGNNTGVAILGVPGRSEFKWVMSSRHMTLRCHGGTDDPLPFGGPIVYGHAASGFHELPQHPGNIFIGQSRQANRVYRALSDRQRIEAVVPDAPRENCIQFRGTGGRFDGVRLADVDSTAKQLVAELVNMLWEPYRELDGQRARAALEARGGLEACHLAFYGHASAGDNFWEQWRLEGPGLVWHFRGLPHVHAWVNVAKQDYPVPSAVGSKSLRESFRRAWAGDPR